MIIRPMIAINAMRDASGVMPIKIERAFVLFAGNKQRRGTYSRYVCCNSLNQNLFK